MSFSKDTQNTLAGSAPGVAAVWMPLPESFVGGSHALLDWLSRGDIERRALPLEPLDALMYLLGRRADVSGRAALRFYGQTGDTPNVWMAAADPVYLEPRLDHLFLHALPSREFEAGALRKLFDHLHDQLANDGVADFARIGRMGYLRADQPLETATLSAAAVDQRVPNDWMPAGLEAAGFRQLLSEIEMALHDHPVNAARVEAGRFPVNSLWLWGGGMLPVAQPERLPPLFCNDPLLLGLWRLNESPAAAWPGSMERCLEASADGFAALIPFAAEHVDDLEPALATLQDALRRRELTEVRLFFANGVVVRLRRGHRWRWWRKAGQTGLTGAGGIDASDR